MAKKFNVNVDMNGLNIKGLDTIVVTGGSIDTGKGSYAVSLEAMCHTIDDLINNINSASYRITAAKLLSFSRASTGTYSGRIVALTDAEPNPLCNIQNGSVTVIKATTGEVEEFQINYSNPTNGSDPNLESTRATIITDVGDFEGSSGDYIAFAAVCDSGLLDTIEPIWT